MILFFQILTLLMFSAHPDSHNPAPYNDIYYTLHQARVEIGALTEKVISNHAEKSVTFVAIGRSPTPISTHLELLGHRVKHLPITDLHKLQYHDHKISQRVQTYLHKRITSFRASKIVFLDFVSSGASIIQFNDLIKDLDLPEHEFVLFTEPKHNSGLPDLIESRIQSKYTFYTADDGLAYFLLGQKFDPFSKFKAFEVTSTFKETDTPLLNPNHYHFLKAFKDVFGFSSTLPICKSLLFVS